jgi:hypothetical protein
MKSFSAVSTPSEKKQRLLAFLYEAKEAVSDEKPELWDKLHAEIDLFRAGTPYSRQQVKDLLYRDGYQEYAKRRRIADRAGI